MRIGSVNALFAPAPRQRPSGTPQRHPLAHAHGTAAPAGAHRRRAGAARLPLGLDMRRQTGEGLTVPAPGVGLPVHVDCEHIESVGSQRICRYIYVY